MLAAGEGASFGPMNGDFSTRMDLLPRLGLGVSTEYGAFDQPGALDPEALVEHDPRFAGFLEVGVEVARGLDIPTRRWVDSGRPTTYHFLDVNLDEPEDFDAAWLDGLRASAAELRPAWLCGDAGLWHFGRRERGHMLLLPPVLSTDQVEGLAGGIVRLREATGLEVLPENPPGSVYLGDLHLLDFFARVCERADTGFLLDVAHLAIYQRATGHAPLDGLDGFPLEWVVEIHVAGGEERSHEGYRWVEDAHAPTVLDDTWQILDAVLGRTPNLKAVVFECERNPLESVAPVFAEIARRLQTSSLADTVKASA
jgi:uncharacterized protein (UPF0276 family)